MAPSEDEIEQALLDATYQVYQATPDETTVNKVRKQTEENLSLNDGFFSSAEWKQKSKSLIKERVGKLMDGWVPDSNKNGDSDGEDKTGVKRSSPDAESPEPKPKRQKRITKPRPKPKSKKANKKEESDVESDLESKPSVSSELSDLSEEEKPQKKRKRAAPTKTAPKHKPKAVEPEEEDEEDAIKSESEVPGDNDDEVENGELTSEKATSSTKPQNSENGEEGSKGDENKPVVDEEEEYSDVIDEPVKPKRKRKEKKEVSSKPAKGTKVAVKKVTTSDDPNTEEIKRLQGQLTKCGIRKLWHNELKKYGDDAKAKIRHLRKMLTDIGMDGRFSEAKAREIKERRELLAEVESAQEMSALWGVEGRGRASRSKSKSAKVVESGGSDAEENDGNENNDDEEDEEETYAARRKRARADLAFLGDDDSDSD
ncbi:transcription factor [Fusarium phyllophilum]|uniref:Transcription factor n=1 Tax=Fusarium phyllophilum TaxID=47803 RepID=A0A8H5K7K9_9HYPO|nr:transcription factor [Fusarium phyllophilum]